MIRLDRFLDWSIILALLCFLFYFRLDTVILPSSGENIQKPPAVRLEIASSPSTTELLTTITTLLSTTSSTQDYS